MSIRIGDKVISLDNLQRYVHFAHFDSSIDPKYVSIKKGQLSLRRFYLNKMIGNRYDILYDEDQKIICLRISETGMRKVNIVKSKNISLIPLLRSLDIENGPHNAIWDEETKSLYIDCGEIVDTLHYSER